MSVGCKVFLFSLVLVMICLQLFFPGNTLKRFKLFQYLSNVKCYELRDTGEGNRGCFHRETDCSSHCLRSHLNPVSDVSVYTKEKNIRVRAFWFFNYLIFTQNVVQCNSTTGTQDLSLYLLWDQLGTVTTSNCLLSDFLIFFFIVEVNAK